MVLFTPLAERVLGDDERGTFPGVPFPASFSRWPPAFALAFLAVLSGRMAGRAPAGMRRVSTMVAIINYASMFEASLVAFVVGSAFLNRAHFDLFYHWVALVIAFGLIAGREMADELSFPGRSQGGRGELEHVSRPGFGRRVPVSGYRSALPAHGG